MPSLKIGDVTARLPIIQGGMAVRISLAPLAGAVAREGGIGVIAGSGLTPDELRAEIRAAREIAAGGVLGVNIMVAVRNFAELVKAAIAEKIDLVIAGAGFSRDVFDWTREAGIPMVPIVGSPRVAELSQKFGAAAVVVEGYDAGVSFRSLHEAPLWDECYREAEGAAPARNQPARAFAERLGRPDKERGELILEAAQLPILPSWIRLTGQTTPTLVEAAHAS